MKCPQANISAVLTFLLASARANLVSQEKRQISSLVTGTPFGFASGTTGGGDGTVVYPGTIYELEAYLLSDDALTIVIDGVFNFTGSEGETTFEACNAYDCTPDEGGQALLNTLGGCTGDVYDVQVDAAASTAINIHGDKTIVGQNGATMIGKGLRLVEISNVIIQNIEITNLNPKYVWGGDAISLSEVSNVWVDHVTASPCTPGSN